MDVSIIDSDGEYLPLRAIPHLTDTVLRSGIAKSLHVSEVGGS